MNKEKKKIQKERHDAIMNIKRRIAAGQPTTFQERNIVKIYDKKMAKKNKIVVGSIICLWTSLECTNFHKQ